MSTKAYYPISEIGAGKPGFSKTRSIIEAAFYGNNVVKVNTLKEAYELAKNSLGNGCNGHACIQRRRVWPGEGCKGSVI